MSEITIYTTTTCPKCVQLKNFFDEKGISYKTADMSTPEAQTELKFNGIFTMSAPVLQVGEEFLTHKDIFSGSDVDTDTIMPLVA
jgi:glutaredoxin